MGPRISFRGSNHWLRSGLQLGLLAATVSVAPLACFFPDFTFNDNGGAAGATTSTGGNAGSGGNTATTTTTGGGGNTTSSSMSTGAGGTGGSTGGSTGGGGNTGGTTTGGGGTGGDTGGTTTSSSSTSSSTTSSSTMPPVEDCQNGMDDDGDGLIDCKDTTDCADYACINAIPNGWTGYFQLYQGTVAGDPGCSVGFPMDAYSGNFNLNAPPAVCNACLCGSPQAQTCTPPSIINVLDCPCGGSPTVPLTLTMPAGWGACSSAQGPNGGYYFMGGKLLCGPDMMQPCNQAVSADGASVTGGFCASSGGGGTAPMAKWDGFAHACGGALTTGKGCNLGQTCLPKPKAPNDAAICIKRAGDFNCPAGQFSTKYTFYDDFTDSRACSSCSCDTPMNSTCSGNITIYADGFLNACTSPDVTFAAGTCAPLVGNPSAGNSKFTQTAPPSGGSCAPIGGQPIGAATKTFPQTYCCAATP